METRGKTAARLAAENARATRPGERDVSKETWDHNRPALTDEQMKNYSHHHNLTCGHVVRSLEEVCASNCQIDIMPNHIKVSRKLALYLCDGKKAGANIMKNKMRKSAPGHEHYLLAHSWNITQDITRCSGSSGAKHMLHARMKTSSEFQYKRKRDDDNVQSSANKSRATSELPVSGQTMNLPLRARMPIIQELDTEKVLSPSTQSPLVKPPSHLSKQQRESYIHAIGKENIPPNFDWVDQSKHVWKVHGAESNSKTTMSRFYNINSGEKVQGDKPHQQAADGDDDSVVCLDEFYQRTEWATDSKVPASPSYSHLHHTEFPLIKPEPMEDDDLWWRSPLEAPSSTPSGEVAPLRYSAIKLEQGLPYITPEPEHCPYAPVFLLDGHGGAPVVEPQPEDYPHTPYFASGNFTPPKDEWKPLIRSEGSHNPIKQEVHDFINQSDIRCGLSMLQSAKADDEKYLDVTGLYSDSSVEIDNEQNAEKESLPSTFQLPLHSLGLYPQFET